MSAIAMATLANNAVPVYPIALASKVRSPSDNTSFNPLPKIGAAFHGGCFAGILSDTDGAPYALILLPAELAAVDWYTAKEWTKTLDADLPRRCEAAMLLNSFPQAWGAGWAWTNEDYFRQPATCAWGFYENGGRTTAEDKTTAGNAFAVRRLPIDLGGRTVLGRTHLDINVSTPSDTLDVALPGNCSDVGAVAGLSAEDAAALAHAVLFMQTFVDHTPADDDEKTVALKSHLDAARSALANLTIALRHQYTQQAPV